MYRLLQGLRPCSGGGRRLAVLCKGQRQYEEEEHGGKVLHEDSFRAQNRGSQ